MKKKTDHKFKLELFKKEVKELNEPYFIDVDDWYLDDELQNGVIIGYTIDDQCARKLIHYIGLKHGLLPLCPNDGLDIDTKDGKILGSFIRSDYGKLRIKTIA